MKYNKIALIGMPGCGKSKTAKIISEKLNYAFFDTDAIFEKKHCGISEYFEKYGEDKFRYEESLILSSIVKNDNFILSTGGGIVLLPENRDILFGSNIVTFYLKTSENELLKRLTNDSSRPLLNNSKDKFNSIVKLASSREKYYSKASFIINTDCKSADMAADEIIEIIK